MALKHARKQGHTRGANNGGATKHHNSSNGGNRYGKSTLLPPLGKYKVERMEPARSPPSASALVSPPPSPPNAQPVDALPRDRKRKAVEKVNSGAAERRTRLRREKPDVAPGASKEHGFAKPVPLKNRITPEHPREVANQHREGAYVPRTEANAVPLGVRKRRTNAIPDMATSPVVSQTHVEGQALSSEPARREEDPIIQDPRRDRTDHRDPTPEDDGRHSNRHYGRNREKSPAPVARTRERDEADRNLDRGRPQHHSGNTRREHQYGDRSRYRDTHRSTRPASRSRSPHRYRGRTPPQSAYHTGRDDSSRPRHNYSDHHPYSDDRDYHRDRGYSRHSRHKDRRDRRDQALPRNVDTHIPWYQRDRPENDHSMAHRHHTDEPEHRRSPNAPSPWPPGNSGNETYRGVEANRIPQRGYSRSRYSSRHTAPKGYCDPDHRGYEEQELPYEGRRKPSSSPPRAPSPSMLRPMGYEEGKKDGNAKMDEQISPVSTGDKPVETLKNSYWEKFRARRKGV